MQIAHAAYIDQEGNSAPVPTGCGSRVGEDGYGPADPVYLAFVPAAGSEIVSGNLVLVIGSGRETEWMQSEMRVHEALVHAYALATERNELLGGFSPHYGATYDPLPQDGKPIWSLAPSGFAASVRETLLVPMMLHANLALNAATFVPYHAGLYELRPLAIWPKPFSTTECHRQYGAFVMACVQEVVRRFGSLKSFTELTRTYGRDGAAGEAHSYASSFMVIAGGDLLGEVAEVVRSISEAFNTMIDIFETTFTNGALIDEFVPRLVTGIRSSSLPAEIADGLVTAVRQRSGRARAGRGASRTPTAESRVPSSETTVVKATSTSVRPTRDPLNGVPTASDPGTAMVLAGVDATPVHRAAFYPLRQVGPPGPSSPRGG